MPRIYTGRVPFLNGEWREVRFQYDEDGYATLAHRLDSTQPWSNPVALEPAPIGVSVEFDGSDKP